MIPDAPETDTFDSAFLSELEGLVADSGVAVSSAAQGALGARGYREPLAALLASAFPGARPSASRRSWSRRMPRGSQAR